MNSYKERADLAIDRMSARMLKEMEELRAVDPFSEPEEDEAFAAIEKKQKRYQDAQGEDWIDEAARTFTAEEFRGAMRFTLGKYVRRAGKKDALESEIEKIRDYAARWLEVESNR